jgi:uncharacterized protein (DUF433 family)
MEADLIHNRDGGPEIVGMRITVYNLLPYFLDPTATEAHICQLYELTPEQVAAARAYVLNHADTVMAKHLEIEARIKLGNPPGLNERFQKTHEEFMRFKNWLAHRAQSTPRDEDQEATPPHSGPNGDRSTTIKQWLAECDSSKGEVR